MCPSFSVRRGDEPTQRPGTPLQSSTHVNQKPIPATSAVLPSSLPPPPSQPLSQLGPPGVASESYPGSRTVLRKKEQQKGHKHSDCL